MVTTANIVFIYCTMCMKNWKKQCAIAYAIPDLTPAFSRQMAIESRRNISAERRPPVSRVHKKRAAAPVSFPARRPVSVRVCVRSRTLPLESADPREQARPFLAN